jgi:hypothetical protein
MKAFIHAFLGWEQTDPMLKRGVFGHVAAFMFAEEAQNRGSLHFHGVVVLKKPYTPDELEARMKSDEFKRAYFAFANSIVKTSLIKVSDLPLQRAAHTSATPASPSAVDETANAPDPWSDINVTCRPASVMPDASEAQFTKHVNELAMACQLHREGHSSSCHKFNNTECRFGFPRPLVEETHLDGNQLILRRTHHWLNNFNEYVLMGLRANHDIKLTLPGCDYTGLIWYWAGYMTKIQMPLQNVMGFFEYALKRVEQRDLDAVAASDNEHLLRRARQLITSFGNRLLTHHEVSGPQVLARAMPDCPESYESHTYVQLRLWSHIAELVRLDKENNSSANSTDTDDEPASPADENTLDAVDADADETALPSTCALVSVRNGKVSASKRVDAYENRPQCLDMLSLEEFTSLWDREPAGADPGIELRKRKNKCLQLKSANGDLIKGEWIRERSMSVIPELGGLRLPAQRLHPNEFGRMMLLRFCPWRTLSDLLKNGTTWSARFTYWQKQILPSSSDFVRRTVSNIDALQRDKAAQVENSKARAKRKLADHTEARRQLELSPDHAFMQEEFDEQRKADAESNQNEGDIALRQHRPPLSLDVVGTSRSADSVRNTMTIAKLLDVFERVVPSQRARSSSVTQSAEDVEMHDLHETKSTDSNSASIVRGTQVSEHQVSQWKAEIKQRRAIAIEKRHVPSTTESALPEDVLADDGDNDIPAVQPACVRTDDELRELIARIDADSQSVPHVNVTVTEQSLPSAALRTPAIIAQEFSLNERQRDVFAILVFYTIRELKVELHIPCADLGERNQLLMYMGGMGGVGKTRAIEAWQDFLREIGREHWLQTAAFMGKPAAKLDGRTLHSLLNLGTGKGKQTSAAKKLQLEAFWSQRRFLCIDEWSHIGTKLLKQLLAALCALRPGHGTELVGGLHFIAAGDFHQHDPVKDTPIYRSSDPVVMNLWHAFHTVRFLIEQMRMQDDQAYFEFVQRVQTGSTTQADVEYINTQAITGETDTCPLHRSPTDKWQRARFIVSLNLATVAFNNEVALLKARRRNERLLVSVCVDRCKTSGSQCDTDLQRELFALQPNKAKSLYSLLPLCIGLELTLRCNTSTENHLYNGVEGVVRQIVLDPREPEYDLSPALGPHMLTYLPLYVLMEFPDAVMDPPLSGMGGNRHLVPVFPVDQTFVHTRPATVRDFVNADKVGITRTQLPLSSARVLTSYAAQGMTLDAAIVDLTADAHSFGKRTTTRNAVICGRVRSKDSIALMKRVKLSDLQAPTPDGLDAELRRLARVERATMTWYRSNHVGDILTKDSTGASSRMS